MHPVTECVRSSIHISNGYSIDQVDMFRHLGDMLRTESGADAAVIFRI